jgi:hypothetical protein
VLAPGVRVSLDFLPLHDGQFEAMEKGRLDLVVADDGYAPTHFAKEVIFEVDFVCVVAKESSFSRALTLKQYLAAEHIGISILGGIQKSLKRWPRSAPNAAAPSGCPITQQRCEVLPARTFSRLYPDAWQNQRHQNLP